MRQKQLTDLIDDRIQRQEKAPVVGRVTKVYPKTDDDLETGNIEVNVQTRSRDHEWRRIPFIAFDHPGHTYVPQEGDHVLVDFMSGRGMQPVVTDVVYTEEDRAPNALPGHWRHEFELDDENLYLEAEPADGGEGDPDVIRMGVKPEGLGDPSTEVAVDVSEDDTEVRIKTDGNVTIDADDTNSEITIKTGGDVSVDADGDVDLDANGNVDINSSSGSSSVAVQNHNHNFRMGFGTTSTPNQSGTDTQVG